MKSIKYSIIYNISYVSVEIVERWINLAGQCFLPQNIISKITSRGKFSKYNKKKLFGNLQQELDNNIISIYLSDNNDNSFSVVKNFNDEYLLITFDLPESEIVDWDKEVDMCMVSEDIIVAYKCVSEDYYWQNTDSILSYQVEGRSLDAVKLTHREYGLKEQIIDVEYNPGHVHVVNGIWFGSCYKMWFGKAYYHYIEKDKIKNFKSCYENIELENDVIRIILYEDIWAYNNSQNRKIQWDFRNTVGMDKVAHSLEKCKKNVEVDTDPEIELTNGRFENGGLKLIKYYYDINGNLIQKSKAKKVRICEFNQDGQLLDENNVEIGENKSSSTYT